MFVNLQKLDVLLGMVEYWTHAAVVEQGRTSPTRVSHETVAGLLRYVRQHGARIIMGRRASGQCAKLDM
mgnify:CR=1 FL=1